MRVCQALGLNPATDGWNGLTVRDECPCQRYFGTNGPAYCKEKFPAGVCTAATTHLPAGFPFDPNPPSTSPTPQSSEGHIFEAVGIFLGCMVVASGFAYLMIRRKRQQQQANFALDHGNKGDLSELLVPSNHHGNGL